MAIKRYRVGIENGIYYCREDERGEWVNAADLDRALALLRRAREYIGPEFRWADDPLGSLMEDIEKELEGT